ncbi:hypothetical protein BYT27DRAFT_7261096 [Phlegmacium glaucopus]|nr:hypothetical protein BYT27DRAFT_7261096 [Phlegmacium glaucopus]
MSNPDAPALNADGTLKDASEIEFCHSPSTQEQPLLPDTSKKRKRTTELDQESDSDDTLPSIIAKPLPGLKGKEPARRVASKRVKKPSARVKGNNASPKTCLFFKSNFTVGSKPGTPVPEKSIASAGSLKLQPEDETQVQLRQFVAPGTGLSTLQPEDNTRVQPRQSIVRKCVGTVLASPESTKHVRTETDHPKFAGTTPAHDTDEHMDYTMQGGDNDSEDDEESEDEDAVAKYNRMAEEIHRERSAPRKHNHRGHDDRTRDLRAAFTRATKEEGGALINGHICNACCAAGKKDTFFSGGNSSLRKHYARNWATHGEFYLKICKSLGIEPNKSALPLTDAKEVTEPGLCGFR